MRTTIFEDRIDAGRRLAARLQRYEGRGDVIVLALPRGGVPVAYEVARRIDAPLDVLVVRKLGVPLQPELAFGAVASGGVQVLSRGLIARLGIDDATVEKVTAAARRELRRRELAYRGDQSAPDVKGRTVVLVDDGLATGASMQAAVECVRTLGAARVVVAVPVSSVEGAGRIADGVDDFVCLATPEPFYAIGAFYEDFSQVDDQEVRRVLEHARTASRTAAHGAPGAGIDSGVR